jgi:4-aminobutyrate---pyruvate transaminase
MQNGLRQLAKHPLVGEVRGMGLIGAIELVADKANKVPFGPSEDVGGFLVKRGHQHGIILRAMGDSIAFCPPLIITEQEIDLLLERFGLALADTLAEVRKRRLNEADLTSSLAGR